MRRLLLTEVLELRLTVTDSGGLQDTETVAVQPRTVDLTFATNVPGLELTSTTARARRRSPAR